MMFYDEKITFDSRTAVKAYLEALLNIAISKHYVTIAEIYEGLEMPAGDRDHEFGFTPNDILAAEIVNVRNKWTFTLPGVCPVRYLYPVTSETKPSEPSTSTPEPLYITIHVNEIDVYDPDEILANVFKYVYTIKDRVVNVSIM